MDQTYKHIPCVYFAASEDGFILDVNDSLCRYLHYDRQELIGNKLELIFTLSTRIFQQTHFYPLLQLEGHAEEIYITLKSKEGGHVPMLVNGMRVVEEGSAGFYFAGISVVKRKKFEEEIIAAKHAAQKALNENIALKAAQTALQEYAEELDRRIIISNLQITEYRQFNHLTTHTLQEPVRKLLFFSSQILDTNKDEKSQAISLKIRKATEDIHNKLQGLRQYLWLSTEELELEELDLLVLISAAKAALESEHPGVRIQLDSEPIPKVRANRAQMEFLMKELLSNAVRFRKDGDAVQVRVSASTLLLNKFRELSGKYKYAEFLKVQIEDDGLGFDDEYQEQAFELFRVLHPNAGLGIGLSLCKKILDNHSGIISMESQKGIKTAVIIYLPLTLEEKLPAKANY